MHAFVTSAPCTLRVHSGAFITRKATHTVAKRPAIARMSLQPTELATVLQGVNLAEGGGMAVTFPAYLAVFLGTLIPCAFLVILYIQAESRKAGEKAGRGE